MNFERVPFVVFGAGSMLSCYNAINNLLTFYWHSKSKRTKIGFVYTYSLTKLEFK